MRPVTCITLCFLFLINISLFAQKNAKKNGALSFSVSMSDYSFLKTVKDSSLTTAFKQKDWSKLSKKSFGIGVGYWKGLTQHIDFSGTLTGTFSNFPAKFVKGDSIGQAGFTSQLDALLHFRLLKDKAAFNPFLSGGVGAGYFYGELAAYAPVGVGLQFKFNEGAVINLQAQWRMALNDAISNDYMLYSIGFIQKSKKIKTGKTKPVIVKVPVAPPVITVVDTDADGVPDEKDSCPLVKGAVNGCPDSDNDGIADKDDKCKDVAGIAKYNGCPFADADNDGVKDEEDKCPGIAGLKENNGCPEVKQEIKEKVDLAAKQIFFDFASDVVAGESFIPLAEVLTILKNDEQLKLNIAAHSDNKGTPARNMFWSEKRAKAVAEYFIANGISSNRIVYKGYGDTQPVADNNTEAGRSKNRRVELKLHY
jgi:OOP family OmpA-OmpF porin